MKLSEKITFRLSKNLVEDIKKTALKEQMTFASFIRLSLQLSISAINESPTEN